MTRLALCALVVAVVGCGEVERIVDPPKLEMICFDKFQGRDGDTWATNIVVSVDGRPAFSDSGIPWWWSDTHEQVDHGMESRLRSYVESVYPTRMKHRTLSAPTMPDCVAAKLAGEPCDDFP